MRIILANPRGFCAGVYMAVDVVDQLIALCSNEPIFVYHAIVHNRHVVERFEARGVTFVESLDEVPAHSIVVFSAHGISPEIRKQARARSLTAIDASCPLVMKVHAEVIRYAKKGFQIVLVGHRNHQEIIGTSGEAPESIQIVESTADIPRLVIHDPSKVVYLTQTTLSVDDAQTIIAALKQALPLIHAPAESDICYATTNRQEAVRRLAPECDLAIVVGSRNSSNSVRLTEIAHSRGTPARLVDDVNELQPEWFAGVNSLLLTAGASAPEDLVMSILESLVTRFGGTIEQHDVSHEGIEFGLPLSLKEFMRSRGIDPDARRIRRGDTDAEVAAWSALRSIPFRTVDLTIGSAKAR
ncbi:MAG: 4-hydroxy-3-methylbut-2-enyl diphosphate reductase [Planctomycetota bacterium]|nr:4-hydroxy-3-methylbut-2-enyl diphosphate reductase [Planctomycetota bacterium]